MSTQALTGLIEECLDARASLEEKRQHGEAIGPAAERAGRASAALAALVAQLETSHAGTAQVPSLAPLIHAVRGYLVAEAAVEHGPAETATPAKVLENLHYARRTLLTQLRAYRLVQGISEMEAAGTGTEPTPRGPRMLIAIDGSTPSTWAIRFGGQLADALHAHVMLLHVGEPIAAGGNELVYATSQLQEEHRERHVHWRDLLERARRALPNTVRCETVLRSGSPAPEILHVARAWQADLIVMGTRGRGRLTQLLLGSVAEAVIRGAPCPVVTLAHEPARTGNGHGIASAHAES